MGSLPSPRDVGLEAIEKAVNTTINNVEKLNKQAEASIKKAEKKSGVNVNGGTSTSKKFGEGGSAGQAPTNPNDPLAPGYRDPYAGFSKEGYTTPGPGGQLDLGRPGDPSNPLPLTPTPWAFGAGQGQAPENPPPFAPVAIPYNKQKARLKYRKYALDRGL